MKKVSRNSKKRTIRDAEEVRFLRKLGVIITGVAANQKVSLERLAYESGISKGFIYDLANGNGNPSILVLHRLANANGLSLVSLLKGL